MIKNYHFDPGNLLSKSIFLILSLILFSYLFLALSKQKTYAVCFRDCCWGTEPACESWDCEEGSGWVGVCATNCGSPGGNSCSTGSCSVSCGGGQQLVTCTNRCGGINSQSWQSCNTQACCTGVYGSCTAWSACSVSCGGGTQTRTCYDTGCGTAQGQSQTCNTQSCNSAPNAPSRSSIADYTWTKTQTICATTTDPDANTITYDFYYDGAWGHTTSSVTSGTQGCVNVGNRASGIIWYVRATDSNSATSSQAGPFYTYIDSTACVQTSAGTFTITASCAFKGTINGISGIGDLVLTSGATLTINAGQTIAWSPGGKVIIPTGASIAINSTASTQLKQTNLWAMDSDGDGYHVFVAATNAPTGGVVPTASHLSKVQDANDASISIH